MDLRDGSKRTGDVLVATVPHAADEAGRSDAVRPAATRQETLPHPFSPRIQAALAVLLEAYDYAQDLRLDPWDFAVELPTLRPLGLTNSDCRWLAGKGLVECAFELTLAGDERRSFRLCASLKLSKRTCLVLTEAGVAATGGKVQGNGRFERSSPVIGMSGKSVHRPISFPAILASAGSAELTPTWDRDRQQLRLGNVIVKQFKVPAPNQEAILAAFQEENWPPRIDDPLSPQPDQDPKRRLHDTINSLNRNQKRPLLRFLGDGSGQGVRWEFLASGHQRVSRPG
ncbi:MAG TPA: hypothetical protein VG056_04705 [Pirellulales bacterium]|nr:hypothetical protein [Pirellulales bacterium]